MIFKKSLLLLALAFFSCSAENPFQSFYTQMYLNDGNRFYNEGEYKKAAEFYTKAIEMDPQGDTRYFAFYYRGSSYFQLAKYTPAVDDLTAAVRVLPRSQNAFLLRGRCFMKMQQLDEAKADFDQVVVLNPSNAAAHYWLGEYFYSLNSIQKAMGEYTSAAYYDPTMDEAYRRRGDIMSSIDLFPDALDNYSRAIQLNPTNRFAYEGRGLVNARIGKKVNATLDTLTANDIKRWIAKSYWKNALAALGKSDTETALRMYGLSLEIDPTGSAGSGNPGDTYYDRGMVFLHEKEYEQALVDFKKTVSLNPKNRKANSSLGMCYYELGYFQAAGEQFRSSLRNDPRDDLSIYYLGKIELQLNQPEKAIEQFTSALTMDPKLLRAFEERADAYQKLGSFQNALSDYNTLLDKGWTDPSVLLKRGKAFDALGFYDDAVADFSEFIRVSPKKDAPYGFLNRADSFMGMKKYALAYRDYSKYLFSVMTNGAYETNSVSAVLTNMNKCYQFLVKRRKI